MVWADIKMLSPETLRNHWNLFLTLLEVREVQSQDSASLCYSRDSCTSVLMAVLVIIAKNGIGLDGFQLWMDDENVICVKIKSHSNKKENVICVYVYTHTYIPISALKKNEILGRWWAFWNIIVSGRNFRKMEDILKYYSEWVSQAQKDTCLYILSYMQILASNCLISVFKLSWVSVEARKQGRTLVGEWGRRGLRKGIISHTGYEGRVGKTQRIARKGKLS